MSRPNVETFSGSHQSSMGSGSPYLPFISKLTFVVCPAFTSTSLSCLPSVSCQTSIFCLPAGTFSSLATPLLSVTAATPGTTATQPSIPLCTSQVTFTKSGFSSFCGITTTWGTNLHPCWSMTPLALLVPLAPGAEATALASPLLAPTTTCSTTVSVPHF